MPRSSTKFQAPPSACIEEALVWLLGLSFGEHDDGVQRSTISRKLGEIINLWASGLLAADFSAEEVENTFAAFSKLVQTDNVPDLINWSEISISDVDLLIHIHWVRASRNMIDLPLPPAKPLETAIDSLTVALKLLDCIAAKDNRRSAAANTAPAHLLFSVLRLTISTKHEHNHRGSNVRVLCDQLLSHLNRMRRTGSKSHLFSSLLSHILPLIRTAVGGDLSSFKAPYSVHQAAPASHVLHTLLCEVEDDKLIESVSEIMPTLQTLVESVQEEIRIQALHSMSLLSSRLSVSAMEPTETSKSLQASLAWGDVPTSMVAIPLLATFLPATKPKESRGEDYVKSVSKVIDIVVRHMQKRSESPEANGHDLPDLTDAKAAIELSTFVPSLARDLLICRTDWIIALCDFLQRLAVLLRRGSVPIEDVIRILAVLQDSIKWAWIRVDSFRREVFENCLSSIMETRSVSESFLIQTTARDVILLLGKCGQVERLLDMTAEVRTCARDYESLATAAEFCKDIEDIIAFEGEDNYNGTISAGTLVHRFFPELT